MNISGRTDRDDKHDYVKQAYEKKEANKKSTRRFRKDKWGINLIGDRPPNTNIKKGRKLNKDDRGRDFDEKVLRDSKNNITATWYNLVKQVNKYLETYVKNDRFKNKFLFHEDVFKDLNETKFNVCLWNIPTFDSTPIKGDARGRNVSTLQWKLVAFGKNFCLSPFISNECARCYGKEEKLFKKIFKEHLSPQIAQLNNHSFTTKILNGTKEITFTFRCFPTSDMVGNSCLEGCSGGESSKMCLKYTVMYEKCFVKEDNNYLLEEKEYESYDYKEQPIQFIHQSQWEEAVKLPFYENIADIPEEVQKCTTYLWSVKGWQSFLTNITNMINLKHPKAYINAANSKKKKAERESARRSFARNDLRCPYHDSTIHYECIHFAKDVLHCCVALAAGTMKDLLRLLGLTEFKEEGMFDKQIEKMYESPNLDKKLHNVIENAIFTEDYGFQVKGDSSKMALVWCLESIPNIFKELKEQERIKRRLKYCYLIDRVERVGFINYILYKHKIEEKKDEEELEVLKTKTKQLFQLTNCIWEERIHAYMISVALEFSHFAKTFSEQNPHKLGLINCSSINHETRHVHVKGRHHGHNNNHKNSLPYKMSASQDYGMEGVTTDEIDLDEKQKINNKHKHICWYDKNFKKQVKKTKNTMISIDENCEELFELFEKVDIKSIKEKMKTKVSKKNMAYLRKKKNKGKKK